MSPIIANKVTLTEPELMAQVKKMVPEYAVPSRGLASTPQDTAKFTSSVVSGGGLKPETAKFFKIHAPGWDVCIVGSETILRSTGIVINNGGAAIYVLPEKKTSLILMWSLLPDSTNDLLLTPSQEILGGAFNLPKDNWVCTR